MPDKNLILGGMLGTLMGHHMQQTEKILAGSGREVEIF